MYVLRAEIFRLDHDETHQGHIVSKVNDICDSYTMLDTFLQQSNRFTSLLPLAICDVALLGRNERAALMMLHDQGDQLQL